MDQVQKTLLKTLSGILFTGETRTDVDRAVLEEATKQAVQAIIDKNSFQVIVSNARLMFAHHELCELMKNNNIKCVTIKGWASAYYYPNPLLRHLGDVDFFVPIEDRERVSDVLVTNGYKLTEDKNPHHWSYKKNGKEYELHWRLNGAPEGKIGDIIDEYVKNIWDESRTVFENGRGIQIPSDFHNGLIMILHMARHMTSSGMGLRHLCDWAVFVNKINDFEGMFHECFQRIGLWHYACVLTETCVEYLGLPMCEWSNRENISPDLLEQVIDNVLGSGNFGRKETENYSSLLLGDINTDGGMTKHSKFYNMMKSLNGMSRYYVPITKKTPFLLPIGWVYVVIQYLLRVKKGKRKLLNPFRIMKKATGREKLYSELKLFQ